MKRFAVAVTVIAALVALVPAPVAAEKPAREGLPAAPFTLDASICGFAVDVAFPTNKEFMTTFSNGKQIVTGSLFSTLTNEQNHKSLTMLPGPEKHRDRRKWQHDLYLVRALADLPLSRSARSGLIGPVDSHQRAGDLRLRSVREYSEL